MTYEQIVATMAANAHRLGNHELALMFYREIAHLHPLFEYDMAVQLRALDRHQEALQILTGFLRKQPNSFLGWTNAGDSATKLGHRQAAVQFFAHALQLAPSTERAHRNAATAHHNLSRELLGTNDLAGALSHAEEAVRLEPNDPEHVMGLGEAQLLSGDYANGWENYEARFLRNFNDNSPAAKLALVLKSWRGTSTQIGELDMAKYYA